ncbi:MAG: AmmeMemoRadiSam system protein A [Phycisphaerae bacterium]|nr:AmmeMemoRadiSam system protein A [Phycisphaerae bacterium]
MNDEQKNTLLRIARDSVEASVKGNPLPSIKVGDAELVEKRGCFVTLKTGENLRGCIGQFTSDVPLAVLVSLMAKSSATEDPRFASIRITTKEFDFLTIEISVLSKLKKTNDPLSLRLGTDGIYIKKGMASGCFLPQVADETGWSKEEFLSYCCLHKAGLPAEAWKDKDTEVFLFTAEIFWANYKDIQ